jgi:15-cis-phytoene synthase
MPARPESPATRALAWLYCGAQQRPLFAGLCAIEREVNASLRPGLEHHVAHARLSWWREECVRCAQGEPVHPLTRELADLPGGRAALPTLAGLPAIAIWDLARATFETRAELREYCARWSESLLEPLVAHADPALGPAAARAIGCALHELELLIGLAADARAGRLRLPLDELATIDTDPGELARAQWPAPLATFVAGRHQELRARLTTCIDPLTPAAQSRLRGVIVWAALLVQRSLRAESLLPHAARQRDARFSDGWHAWRAARSAQAGRGLGGAPRV